VEFLAALFKCRLLEAAACSQLLVNSGKRFRR
jgi:hypothetical protein